MSIAIMSKAARFGSVLTLQAKSQSRHYFVVLPSL